MIRLIQLRDHCNNNNNLAFIIQLRKQVKVYFGNKFYQLC